MSLSVRSAFSDLCPHQQQAGRAHGPGVDQREYPILESHNCSWKELSVFPLDSPLGCNHTHRVWGANVSMAPTRVAPSFPCSTTHGTDTWSAVYGAWDPAPSDNLLSYVWPSRDKITTHQTQYLSVCLSLLSLSYTEFSREKVALISHQLIAFTGDLFENWFACLFVLSISVRRWWNVGSGLSEVRLGPSSMMVVNYFPFLLFSAWKYLGRYFHAEKRMQNVMDN